METEVWQQFSIKHYVPYFAYMSVLRWIADE